MASGFDGATFWMTASPPRSLHGIGGANSRYARPVDGNARTGCEKLVPLTEALQWLERTDSTVAAEQHFAHLLEEA